MSETPADARVPIGVLQGIEDIAEGRTMSDEELEAVLAWTTNCSHPRT